MRLRNYILTTALSLSVACTPKFHIEDRTSVPTNIDSLTTIVRETSKLIPKKILKLIAPKTKIVIVDSMSTQPEFEDYFYNGPGIYKNWLEKLFYDKRVNQFVGKIWGSKPKERIFNKNRELDKRFELAIYLQGRSIDFGLVHEIGHISGIVLGNDFFGQKLRDTKEFREVFTIESKKITLHMRKYYSTIGEWYAQSFKLFYDPKKREFLRTNFPATYKFHETIEARLN